MKYFPVFFMLMVLVSFCKEDEHEFSGRTFRSGFESVDDFDGFYIETQNHMGSASHDISTEQVHSGTFAHKGWIYGANAPGDPLNNTNHRGYPTIQFQKTPGGSFKTPCYVELWVWLDMNFKPGEWFSFMTLTPDSTDNWARTVLINLSDENIVHLMHVPEQGQGVRIFQTTTVKFPMKEWVKLSVCLDLDAVNGYAKVWQNGTLVSHARVSGGNGRLAQAHFGLYAPPSMTSGVIFNDDLLIRENTCEPD